MDPRERENELALGLAGVYVLTKERGRTRAQKLKREGIPRHERGALIVTTNLPFGEWTKVFADPRLAKAVVDRLTHRAHIIALPGTHPRRSRRRPVGARSQQCVWPVLP